MYWVLDNYSNWKWWFDRLFEYDFKDKKIKIPFKDILYIETVGSAYKLNLVGKNFQKEIAGSLSDVLEKDVEDRYFSPHQSYIVNRSMIIGMDKKKKHLLLKEGYSCPISRSNIKRVKKLIEEQNLEFSAWQLVKFWYNGICSVNEYMVRWSRG